MTGEARGGETTVRRASRPTTPAYVLRDDADALRVAAALGESFARGASERDQLSLRDELDAFSQWKYHFVGDTWLNGKPPPSTGTL